MQHIFVIYFANSMNDTEFKLIWMFSYSTLYWEKEKKNFSAERHMHNCGCFFVFTLRKMAADAKNKWLMNPTNNVCRDKKWRSVYVWEKKNSDTWSKKN